MKKTTNMMFLAPDNGTNPPAPTPSIAAVDPNLQSQVGSVPVPGGSTPAPTSSVASNESDQPIRRRPSVLDALGMSKAPSETIKEVQSRQKAKIDKQYDTIVKVDTAPMAISKEDTPLEVRKKDPVTGRFVATGKTEADLNQPEPVIPEAKPEPVIPKPEVQPSAPVSPEEKPKTKYKGKEYTEEELEALFEKKEGTSTTPEPPKATTPPVPTPPAATQPDKESKFLEMSAFGVPNNASEEELKEFRSWQDGRDREIVSTITPWMENQMAGLASTVDKNGKVTHAINEDVLDTILGGGSEAVKAFSDVINKVLAVATVTSQRAIAPTYNNELRGVYDMLAPVLQERRAQEEAVALHMFQKGYPELVDYTPAAIDIANRWIHQAPDEVNSLTRKQFVDAVATKTKAELQRIGVKLLTNKPATPVKPAPVSPVVATPAAVTPPVAQPKPVTPPARTAPASPKPLAGTTVTSNPAPVGSKRAKAIASTLM